MRFAERMSTVIAFRDAGGLALQLLRHWNVYANMPYLRNTSTGYKSL
jgi:hypothetical protein